MPQRGAGGQGTQTNIFGLCNFLSVALCRSVAIYNTKMWSVVNLENLSGKLWEWSLKYCWFHMGTHTSLDYYFFLYICCLLPVYECFFLSQICGLGTILFFFQVSSSRCSPASQVLCDQCDNITPPHSKSDWTL